MGWLLGQRVPFARSVTGPVVTVTALSVALLEAGIRLAPWWFVGTGRTLWLAFPAILLLVALAAVVEGAVPRLLAAPAVAVALLYLYTALLLPWDQPSYVVAMTALEGTLAVPLVGDPLARLLFGGDTLGVDTLRNARLIHDAIVVGTAAGAVVAFVESRRRTRTHDSTAAGD